MLTRRTPLVATLVFGLVACSDDLSAPVGEAVEEQITADVAAVVADQTPDDIAMMTDEGEDAMDPELHRRCPKTGQRFRCAARRFDDLEISRDVTFYADDQEQDAYDAMTTDSITIAFQLAGERVRQDWSVSVEQTRELTVSGLEGEESERTWNGTGSTELSGSRHIDNDGLREYDMSSSSTIDDVVVLVPREGTWPQSGTITREITVVVKNGFGDTFTRERTVVVTFNGTQFVPMVVNGVEFTLDLETRQPARDDA
jgi:hypothetical protein